MKRLRLTLGIGCILLSACGTKSDDANVQSSAGGDVPAGSGVTAEMTLAGGKEPGTYKHQSAIPCADYGPAGLAVSGMGDSTNKIGRIDFYTKAKSGSTDDFELRFPKIGDPTLNEVYRIEPKKGEGSGTATITGSAPEYVITVNGKTADGVAIQGTIHCLK